MLSVLLCLPLWRETQTKHLFLCAEGRPHTVFGTGAGESQSCAGNKDQPDTPARQETHADGQTGEDVYCFIYIHVSLYI